MSLVMVCSGKGAPGATYAALHLAAAFSRASSEALLVDLDPAGGDLVAALGLDPRRGLHPLVATAGEVFNEKSLEAEIESRDGIRAINGFPDAASFPTPETCQRILRMSEKLSANLIVDLGRVCEVNAPLAAHAELVLVVCRTDLVSMLGADRALRMLTGAGVQARHIRLVVNGVPPVLGGDPLEVSRSLGIMTLGVTPAAGRAARAARAGQHPVGTRRTQRAFDRLRQEVCRVPSIPRVEGIAAVTRIGAAQ